MRIFALCLLSFLILNICHASDWITAELPRQSTFLKNLPDYALMVEGGNKKAIKVQGQRELIESLQHKGWPLKILEESIVLSKEHFHSSALKYHNYAAVNENLALLESTYPHLVHRINLGQSTQSRILWGVILSDNPGQLEANEVSFRILATHHGNEKSSTEVALAFAWHLAESYNNNSSVQNLLNQSQVWVVPLVNPDGHVANTRVNANTVDLNRNYAYQWRAETYSGTQPFSEKETQAVRNFSLETPFIQSLSLHSGAFNLGWVWNYTTEKVPDAPFLEQASTHYAEAINEQSFDIMQGADWYKTRGDTNDWSYGSLGVQDYTLELTEDYTPPASQIENYINQHLPAMTQFFALDGQKGLRGRILGRDQQGLEAEISIDDHTYPIYSHPLTGAFQYLLLPGAYKVKIISPGYEKFEQRITIPESGLLEASIQLTAIQKPILSAYPFASLSSKQGTTLCLQGENAEDFVSSGGKLFLQQYGVKSEALSVQVKKDCLEVSITPEKIKSLWQRVGVWTLVFEKNNEVMDAYPNAIVFVETSLSPEQASTDASSILFSNIPYGSFLTAFDSSGYPHTPQTMYFQDSSSARYTFASSDLESNQSLVLRIFGGGNWRDAGTLISQNGNLSWQKKTIEKSSPIPPNSSNSSCAQTSLSLFTQFSLSLLALLALKFKTEKKSQNDTQKDVSKSISK